MDGCHSHSTTLKIYYYWSRQHMEAESRCVYVGFKRHGVNDQLCVTAQDKTSGTTKIIAFPKDTIVPFVDRVRYRLFSVCLLL